MRQNVHLQVKEAMEYLWPERGGRAWSRGWRQLGGLPSQGGLRLEALQSALAQAASQGVAVSAGPARIPHIPWAS